ncbi:unnamed protein product [Mesocestoides corti]|uniref:Protein kinase domain-containing protein n=1 Tax=Mesocestoides corti TaxID=53468 RepID=A0A0R3U1M1_MESCO|nr:unnamed protein product [Mesocestoides corti]
MQPPTKSNSLVWEAFLAAEKKRIDELIHPTGGKESEERQKHRPHGPKLPVAKCSDFFFYQVLGRGGFGEVRLLRHKVAHTWHAAKILLKSMVISRGHVSHVNNERAILALCRMDFIVQLNYAFQDASRLYLVMEFVPGGDLFTMLRHLQRFDERLARFFGGQVLLALEYLHGLQIIHRDIKPENMMLTHNGYLKLVDFGFAKFVTRRTYTFCGTPEYLAPEILLHRGYGPSVDWWAFGILLFEMVVGFSPFVCRDVANTYAKIIDHRRDPLEIVGVHGRAHMSETLRHLISQLLQREVSKRYGSLAREGPREIRNHAWFSEVDWNDLFEQKTTPPYEYPPTNAPSSNEPVGQKVPENHLTVFEEF